MSSKLKLKATAGGSLALIVDDLLSTDEEFNVSNGGIVSGGSAAQSWTKFPDGTLIIKGRGVTVGTAYGQYNPAFLIPFVGDKPIGTCLAKMDPTIENYFGVLGNISLTEIDLYVKDPSTGALIAGIEVYWQVIGRWK